MNNVTQNKIKQLEARHADERARLDRELELMRLIPDDLAAFEVMCHPHKFYDRVGSIHFDYCRYDSTRKVPIMQVADLRRVVAAFPMNVPSALYRDGSVGFRSLADAVRELDKAEQRNPDTSARYDTIASFWLTFDAASYSGVATIHWLTQTSIGIVGIQCEFPLYDADITKIATVSITRTGRGNYRDEPSRIGSKSLNVSRSVQVLENTKASYLRRSDSDDRKEPGELELYWNAYGQESDATLETLLTAIGI